MGCEFVCLMIKLFCVAAMLIYVLIMFGIADGWFWSIMCMFIVFGVGCANNQPKIYNNKIEVYKESSQHILYAKVQERPVAEEYTKINFKDSLIAENRLKARVIQRLNQHEKDFIPVVYQELEKNKRFMAALKVKRSKVEKQHNELNKLEVTLGQAKKRILKIKYVAPLKTINQEKKYERRH